MPFKEHSAVAERIGLFLDHASGAFTVSALCASYGISRETFYYWRRRWQSGEVGWYEGRSRAPSSCPHATPEPTVAAIVAMRHRYPWFGAKKIRALLVRARPEVAWPAASTINAVLKRAGLITAARRQRRPLAQGELVAGAERPNGEWAMDFKGWFRTRDGKRIDPLTVSDTASRYLVSVEITAPTHEGVQASLRRVFEEIGLPEAIRMDNGTPFGARGGGGLSRFSVWLLKLGIEPRYIPPSSPQHNGRHERLHRTLKAATSRPPAATAGEQQARFDRFRQAYNEERPHEALGQRTPANCWLPPSRTLPARLEEPWYDADHEVRRVKTDGTIPWRGEHVFVGHALARETIGLEAHESGGHLVRFMTRNLGLLDLAGRFHRFAPPRWKLREAVQPATTDSG